LPVLRKATHAAARRSGHQIRFHAGTAFHGPHALWNENCTSTPCTAPNLPPMPIDLQTFTKKHARVASQHAGVRRRVR
jgi:hypothetical protein